MKINGKTTNSLTDKVLQKSIRSRLFRTIDCFVQRSYNEPPFAILIDPTTQCNLSCSWCIDKQCINDKFISLERILSLLNELKQLDVRSIVYSGGGEPMMHKDIGIILRKTKELSIDYAICTNGVLLDRASFEIASGSTWCRISLDAGNKETYKRLHNSDNYEIILKNIAELVKYRKQLKSLVTIGISYIIMDENYKEMTQITEQAKNLGCNFIQFKPLIHFNNNVRRCHVYNPYLIKDISEQIDNAHLLETEDFLVIHTDPLQEIIDQGDKVKHYNFCYAQQIIPLITPTGVYPCGNWRGVNEKRMGDINNNTFSAILNSRERKKIIGSLNPQQECNFPCIRHKTNELLSILEKSKELNIDIFRYLIEIDENSISDNNFY